MCVCSQMERGKRTGRGSLPDIGHCALRAAVLPDVAVLLQTTSCTLGFSTHIWLPLLESHHPSTPTLRMDLGYFKPALRKKYYLHVCQLEMRTLHCRHTLEQCIRNRKPFRNLYSDGLNESSVDTNR